MIYTDFKGERLSTLGFGTMRMPLNGIGPEATVDETQMSKMVAYAIDHGVNYFDTAYSYHRFESEYVIGRILKHYPRSSFYLATKYPGHVVLPAYEPKRARDDVVYPHMNGNKMTLEAWRASSMNQTRTRAKTKSE
jgi:predicted aldo/keto reductase-like oxidoreductase